MDPTVLSAVVGAGGTVVGAAIAGPVVAHILSRKLRAAQAVLATAQAEQHKAQAEQLSVQTVKMKQEIYQEITQDLSAELARVKQDLRDARESLRLTSAEAERLRLRVVELESRLAHLHGTEAELRTVQAERDHLRIRIAEREATISALQQQIGDLKAQAATLQATAYQAG